MVENMEKPKIEIVEVSEDNRYGKFVCEPLERFLASRCCDHIDPHRRSAA